MEDVTDYAIMRCAKIKSMGSAAASLQHLYRERETPNSDPARQSENRFMHGDQATTDAAMGRLRERLPEKRRKDAVVCVEYVFTASPGWWSEASKEQQDEFFKRSTAWAMRKYGKDNVIAAGIHRDESTPHLSLFVTPVTEDGRLSAKQFIGNKKQMSLDQDSFAAAVKPLGLERGVRGSQAKHERVKRFYGALEAIPKAPELSPDELVPRKTGWRKREDPETMAERINKRLSKDTEAIRAQSALASSAASTARGARSTINRLAAQLRDSHKLQRIWSALSPDERKVTAEIAESRLADRDRGQARPGKDQRRGSRPDHDLQR